MCCTGFCISNFHTWHCKVWWKIHCIDHFLFPYFDYVYIVSVVIPQCSAKNHHGFPWDEQYRKSVGFMFATTHVPGCIIGLFSKSNYCAMRNWSNSWWWRRDGKIMFRVVFYCGRIWYHSFRLHLVSDIYTDPTQNDRLIYVFPFLCSFLK